MDSSLEPLLFVLTSGACSWSPQIDSSLEPLLFVLTSGACSWSPQMDSSMEPLVFVLTRGACSWSPQMDSGEVFGRPPTMALEPFPNALWEPLPRAFGPPPSWGPVLDPLRRRLQGDPWSGTSQKADSARNQLFGSFLDRFHGDLRSSGGLTEVPEQFVVSGASEGSLGPALGGLFAVSMAALAARPESILYEGSL